ncbi:MAG: uracil phosphoribosyltransferase [Vampirovibrionales bacterium]|nr:uracil phosphoribosyltransferase [Vampirovibrionales bacterium]
MSECSTATTQPLVQCLSHHAVAADCLSVLRNRTTPPMIFRQTVHRLGLILMAEATRNLPTAPQSVATPLETTTCDAINPATEIWLVPILRAGLALTEAAIALLPQARVFHLGMYRNEETLEAVSYYNKLPKPAQPQHVRVIILDPMLATGGSAVSAVEQLLLKGIPQENVQMVSVLAAPEGINTLQTAYPQVSLVTAAIDRQLNEVGYIIPGLGDAGDRVFGT